VIFLLQVFRVSLMTDGCVLRGVLHGRREFFVEVEMGGLVAALYGIRHLKARYGAPSNRLWATLQYKVVFGVMMS